MGKQFFLFIVVIRALAAVVITNSHYTGVYPTDLIANGGLLGDVLFFAVSGYCLAKPQNSFGKWYARRFIRIYIPVWVITAIYLSIGAYTISELEWIKTFIWPTHWHFVASIILLYIPLYFISKHIEMNTRNYIKTAALLLLLQVVLYVTVYDHSYYHIDNVRQPMIEFVFFQSMLMGLHYRWRCHHQDIMALKCKSSVVIITLILACIYFASKMLFVKYESIADYQLVNQVILLTFLYVLFGMFMSLENKLRKFHRGGYAKFYIVIKFISDRTLEIYLVQYVILGNLKIGPFPLNWLLLTSTILVAAIILRGISQFIIAKIKI